MNSAERMPAGMADDSFVERHDEVLDQPRRAVRSLARMQTVHAAQDPSTTVTVGAWAATLCRMRFELPPQFVASGRHTTEDIHA